MRGLAYYQRAFYERLLASQRENPNARRHELMLNIILCGVVLASALAGICAFIDKRLGNDLQQGTTPFNMCVLFVIMLSLWWLSRLGKSLVAAYALLACIGFIALNLMLTWNFELPTAALGCAVLIVIAGIILEARAALRVTVITTLCFLVVAHAQIFGQLHPHSDWLNKQMAVSDAIDYSLLLAVIGLVSWLANLEIDRSLERARATERALADERDSLEIKVAERTSELEQTQRARLLELQRFAEFGRVSASLLHEVANPLTAASLNLDQLGRQQSQSVRQARKSLRQLERYVTAARKQLQDHSQLAEFDARQEIKHLLAMLRPIARKASVQLTVEQLEPIKLFGDAVKFNQIIANVIVNAVDASTAPNNTAIPRQVVLSAAQNGAYLQVGVHDWGSGISAEQLPRIFEPFYTSKASDNRGLGIGLAMVKQSVEHDFGGSINVKSSPTTGTTFTLNLRLRQDSQTGSS
jgi:signal transduction histidine kinase